ncbi:hypothetical protein FJ364_03840 [Candidatus Dependentiae bacterium]|nr:hypothetical protein [Candidatus Dependentiae bacterium]
MKIIKALALTALNCSAVLLHGTTLTPQEIFEKWVKIQHVIQDRDLTTLSNTLNDNYLARFKKNYEDHLPFLRTLQPLLSTITDNAINPHGHLFKPPMTEQMQNNISIILFKLEHNPAAFIEYLQDINFQDPSETTDKRSDSNFIVEKYKTLTKLLLSTQTPHQDEEYSIALVNRLVEFCYQNQTFPLYQKTIQHAEYHSIARMLHTIIWYNIIENGWRLWHEDCLQALKAAANAGKRIKYIAGGNDVYTLLCRGIYNITVIDPFLPSQVRYYANGWEWLLSGNINDEIIGFFGSQELKLVRTSQVEGDAFLAKAANQTVSLKKFDTTWTVYNAESNQKLGTIDFERRFVQKEDLIIDPSYEFLMSYDEFIYLGLPTMLGGWGITPNTLDPSFTCLIKQLRKPMDRDSLNNLRVASIANYADLKFINLASDAN